MRISKRNSGLALISILFLSTPLYAGEMEGAFEKLFTLVKWIIGIVLGIIVMFWVFRKDHPFVLFSIFNLLFFIFFLVLSESAISYESDWLANVSIIIVKGQIVLQGIAIIIALIRKILKLFRRNAPNQKPTSSDF